MEYVIYNESSVVGILGRRGHGKTTLLTIIGEDDCNKGKKIITNYEVSFPHTEMAFEDIVLLPDSLQDCTLLLDELQVGASARTALKKDNQNINKFITQLRKRNIVLYYTTQIFKLVDKDIREQTDYIITTQRTDIENEFKVIVLDRHDFSDSSFGSVINVYTFDATDIFNREVFNTNQIISFGKDG